MAMKKLIMLAFLIIGVQSLQAQKTISIESEGNLESPNPCGCVELSEVTNAHNPADIIIGLGKCIELKDFEKAAKLFAISGVYGTYDSYRVKDKTAHQALLVIQQNVLMHIDEEDANSLMASLEKTLAKDSKELAEVCEKIQEIGVPSYFPKYMIQHGIQAFTDNKGDGLVEDFDEQASWILALNNYLHCGE